MPHLSKRSISQYFRRDCKRRLRFDLYANEQEQEVILDGNGNITPNYPPKRLVNRPGLPLLTQAGIEHENECYNQLTETFGVLARRPIEGTPHTFMIPGAGRRFAFELSGVIKSLRAGEFLIEAQFEVLPSFQEIHGIDSNLLAAILANRPEIQALVFGKTRPDLIQALPPGTTGAEGNSEKSVKRIDALGDLYEIHEDDTRIGLRIIDCKLAGHGSAPHFAEIAYYCMTLAHWLEHTMQKNGRPFSEKFFVRADSAVWPGKHGASEIRLLEQRLRDQEHRTPTEAEYRAAFESDLDFMPEAVFTTRLRRFLTVDLLDALRPADWRELDWHVDNRCIGCEYLGYRWTGNPEAGIWDLDTTGIVEDGGRYLIEYNEGLTPQAVGCALEAQCTSHLSRLSGITTGARQILIRYAVTSVNTLASIRPDSSIFETHQTLRASRSVLADRARMLGSTGARIPNRAGTSVMLPRYADVKVYLIAEFDPASGITVGLGWLVYYFGIRPQTTIRTVREKSIEQEGTVFLDMLLRIAEALRLASQRQWSWPSGDPKAPTVQIYIWDRLTYEHIRRVVGRHLTAILSNPGLRNLCWIFPPETVLQAPNTVSRNSPLCIVSETVRTLLAADVPHHYGLLPLARIYHPTWAMANGARPRYWIHPLFQDPLSDQVPAERALEIWSPLPRPGDTRPNPQDQESHLRQAIETKLRALRAVEAKLTEDLDGTLQNSAPLLSSLLNAGRVPLSGVCFDGLVWYEYARLQKAALEFEVDLIRAMPPHEREARFKSLRVIRLLEGVDRSSALR